ncbi:hypothetical protein [Methanobrevibacter sp. DSM 116169]|uniref:hypothetical protein n=1 Tax=Methanobrevibacter sp. DSM 116169 TaxID=3242727 RepID=UPI0038FC9D14
MNLKRNFFILLILFLFINSVSSAEELYDNKVIEFDKNTFTELDNIVQSSNEGDIIEFKNNLTVQSDEKDKYLNGIEINKNNIIIDGNGYAISGDNSVKLFKITGNNITIKNLNFINSKGSNGVEIYNSGENTTLINNSFNNIELLSGAGGAIYNTGDNFKVLEHNIFSNIKTLSSRGAVIFNNGNNFLIKGSNLFEKNDGGLGVGVVIFNAGDSFKISGDNIFQYNTGFSGVVIYNTYHNFQITGNNIFQYNTASYYGGVIYNNFSSNFTIKGSNIFDGNIATDGGAIYNTYGKDFTIIGNNRIENSYVENSGGGIFNLEGVNFSIIGNNTIKNNFANANGGGVFNSKINGFLLEGSNILENNEAKTGGAIYTSGNNFKINKGSFLNNKALEGSSIFISTNSSLDIRNSEIIGFNQLIFNKGSLFLENNSLKSDGIAVILNEASITSPIYLIFNNNKTIASQNDYYNLTGEIVDDNGNIIISDEIVFNINGNESKSTTLINGLYILNYSIIDYGEYLISGSYDKGTIVNILSSTIIKFKYNTLLNLNVSNYKNGKDINVAITLKDENNNPLNGTVNLILNNGSENKINVINGKGTYLISYLDGGNNTFSVIFKGKEIYGPSNDTVKIEVIKTDINLITNDLEMYYLNGTYNAILKDLNNNPLKNITIYFTINGITYKRFTNDEGIAKLTINLNYRNYTIITLFNGTDDYNKKEITNNIEVKSTIISNNLVKHFKNDTQFSVSVLDNSGSPIKNIEVLLNINGVFYTRYTDNNGIAILNINLNPGTYIITIEHPYNKEKRSNLIDVKQTLFGSDLNKTFGESDTYNVKVLDNIGNLLANVDVIININGIFYSRTSDINGIAKLNINLNPGSYITTATWNGYSTSNKINVL